MSSSKLPHSPNSSPLTPPREPVGQAGLKITRPAAECSKAQCARAGSCLPGSHLLCHPRSAGTSVAGAGTATGTRGTPKKRGGEGEQRHWHTIMLHAGVACAASALVRSVMPARGPGGPSGEVLGKVGGDERRPAGAAASLSSCQMSLKGWKNRLGRASKGQAPGGTSAIPGEIQKMHTLGKPCAPPPPPHPAPPPAPMPWVGGPGKWGGTGSWHGCRDNGMLLSRKSCPCCPSLLALGEPLL